MSKATSAGDGGSVAVHAVTGGEGAQSSRAVELVQQAIERGIPHEQIAIIAPWGTDRDRCALLLRELGVPVFARTDKYWRTTPLTMLIEAMASWSVRRGEARIDLPERLEGFHSLAYDAREHTVQRRVMRLLLDGQASAPAREFLESITQAALDSYAADPRASEDARELQRMRQALAVDGALKDMTVAELGARARAPGHVMAATIHAAKGLEFDMVVLVGADEGGLPGFSPTDEERAEGRRKFYVSITRARDHVHLIYTDQRISKRGNPYPVRLSRSP